MNMIGMSMKPLQANTKFVNHRHPEWRLVVPLFLPSDDINASFNKAMTFISTTFASRYPQTNNQLRTSYIPKNQATIQDGRVTMQNVQERQTQRYTGSGGRVMLQVQGLKNVETNTVGHVNVIRTIFKALESWAILDEEHLAYLADNGQLSVEQAFWLPILKPAYEKQPVQLKPVKKEVPCVLPPISLVNDSFNKMRSHVNNFDNVITVCTKVTSQNERTCGFKHIRGAFEKDAKSFVKTLKEYFHMLTKMEKKELFIENDRLLEHIICQDVMCISMHIDLDKKCIVPANDNHLEYAEMEQSYIDEYIKVLELEVELLKKKDMLENDVYNEHSK
nr:hypothetical protein [Tanacetum cinerariifolium]